MDGPDEPAIMRAETPKLVQGIEHTAIAGKDIAALAEWYVDTLGFTVNYKSANAIFVRAPDGTMIELIHADSDRGEQTTKTQGIRHLALTVKGFDNAVAALRAKNVQFVSEPVESKGNKVVFFTDPEGNYLHLLERATPLA